MIAFASIFALLMLIISVTKYRDIRRIKAQPFHWCAIVNEKKRELIAHIFWLAVAVAWLASIWLVSTAV